MSKHVTILFLAVGVIFGSAMTLEAAPLCVKASRNVAKIGKRLTGFLWENKGAIATGTAIATFAANPEPFIEGATGIAATATEQAIKPVSEEIVKSTAFPNVIQWLCGLAVICFLYRISRNHRGAAKIACLMLAFGFVALGCTELWAASVVPLPQTATVIVPELSWKLVLKIVLFVLTFIPVA